MSHLEMVEMQAYRMDCEIRLPIQFLEMYVLAVYEVTISSPFSAGQSWSTWTLIWRGFSVLPLPFHLSAMFPVSSSVSFAKIKWSHLTPRSPFLESSALCYIPNVWGFLEFYMAVTREEYSILYTFVNVIHIQNEIFLTGILPFFSWPQSEATPTGHCQSPHRYGICCPESSYLGNFFYSWQSRNSFTNSFYS